MDHRQASKLLSPYRDGELAGADREAVAAHVEQCEACKAESEAWGAIAFALFRQATPTPEGFARRVMARLSEESSPAADPVWTAFRRWLVPAFGAAAVAAALAVLIPENGIGDDTEALLVAGATDEGDATEMGLTSSTAPDPLYDQFLEEP